MAENLRLMRIGSNEHEFFKTTVACASGAILGGAVSKSWIGALVGGVMLIPSYNSLKTIITSLAIAAIKVSIDHFLPNQEAFYVCAFLPIVFLRRRGTRNTLFTIMASSSVILITNYFTANLQK